MPGPLFRRRQRIIKKDPAFAQAIAERREQAKLLANAAAVEKQPTEEFPYICGKCHHPLSGTESECPGCGDQIVPIDADSEPGPEDAEDIAQEK